MLALPAAGCVGGGCADAEAVMAASAMSVAHRTRRRLIRRESCHERPAGSAACAQRSAGAGTPLARPLSCGARQHPATISGPSTADTAQPSAWTPNAIALLIACSPIVGNSDPV